MHEGELAMTGRRSGRPLRLTAVGAALLLGCTLALVAGCQEDLGEPTFPPPPEPEARPWLFDVWGSGPSDVWVVGRPGVLVHWNGTDWSRVDLGTTEAITAVWGTGPADVFAVGHKGLAWRYNGSSWSGMATGTSENLYDVGRGPGGSTYICGERAALRRLDGAVWVDTPDTAVRYNPAGTATVDTLIRSDWEIKSLTCIADYAISGSDGIALMTDQRPTRWQLGPVGVNDWLNAGLGSATITENWIATDEGRLFRLQLVNGRFSWLEVSSPSTDAVEDMWGDGTDSWFATRGGDVVRRANSGSSRQVVYTGALPLSGIWGSSANDIWACGYDGTLVHWNGTAWSPVTVPLPDVKVLGPDTDKFGRPLR